MTEGRTRPVSCSQPFANGQVRRRFPICRVPVLSTSSSAWRALSMMRSEAAFPYSGRACRESVAPRQRARARTMDWCAEGRTNRSHCKHTAPLIDAAQDLLRDIGPKEAHVCVIERAVIVWNDASASSIGPRNGISPSIGSAGLRRGGVAQMARVDRLAGKRPIEPSVRAARWPQGTGRWRRNRLIAKLILFRIPADIRVAPTGVRERRSSHG